MAYNARWFDGYFVVQARREIQSRDIWSETKIKNKIIDSFNFLPMACVTQTFGIEEIAKGYFPHMFSTSNNSSYNGTWPATYFYSPSSMKPHAYYKFMHWYLQQIGIYYNFTVYYIYFLYY